MWHGGGWFMYMRSGDEKPKVTRDLLLRVLSYARGYWWHIGGMLVTILLTTGLSLLTPLIFRNMIDVVLPAKDVNRLILLQRPGRIREIVQTATIPPPRRESPKEP